MEIDGTNGNTLWQEAEMRKLNQKTFIDNGSKRPPSGYKEIKVHFFSDVKPTLIRKARLVADVHLTATPIDSIYSSVVSLRGLKTCLFIGKLNSLETWSTDIGNTYLKAYTEEKLFIVTGSEFGEREAHILIIDCVLYGLKSSG